ncbi:MULTISPECIES: hypothetical protein [unclassified Aminobacter]|uniref:hypothetical protein n=1 Tax=unclassified Aminobacter TaxID=2644704 RepID=UPI000467BB80|nr:MULTISPECIES: hypothetical protein [unclassified Aminobacter]TWH35574.1 hypothetical protein L611_001200000550 [Aminobacter sp. J15]
MKDLYRSALKKAIKDKVAWIVIGKLEETLRRRDSEIEQLAGALEETKRENLALRTALTVALS